MAKTKLEGNCTDMAELTQVEYFHSILIRGDPRAQSMQDKFKETNMIEHTEERRHRAESDQPRSQHPNKKAHHQ
jgi:hypothetical protein